MQEIPKIIFRENVDLNIEVMNFTQLLETLTNSKNHNPFEVHKIQFYMILVVTHKSYPHFVDFKSYELKEGSAIFIAKNQVHHFTKQLKNSSGYAIIFNSIFTEKHSLLLSNLKLNRLFNYHIETPVIHQNEMNKDNFTDISKKLFDEYYHPNKFAKSEMLSSLLNVLLLKSERAKEDQSFSGVKKHWLQIFNAFKNLLENNYIETRSSRAYASKLFISYKLLNDIVKNLTGKTTKVFINDFVTIEIKRYLASTSLSIKEISFKTGFDEPSNMVKFFKKNTNFTPLQFRQQ